MKNMKNELLVNLKNVHYFKKEKLTDEIKCDIEKIVNLHDSQIGPFGNCPRLSVSYDFDLPSFHFSNFLGVIFISNYAANDKNIKNQILADVGFKAYKLQLNLLANGFSSSITNVFNMEKALNLAKQHHTMDYDVSLAVVFGYEDDKLNILGKFINWIYSDSYRLPINKIVDGANANYNKLYNAFRNAPSSGNSQTWRIIQQNNTSHFYVTSSLNERFINIGCAISAFDEALKIYNMKGNWKIVNNYPKSIHQYTISCEFN